MRAAKLEERRTELKAKADTELQKRNSKWAVHSKKDDEELEKRNALSRVMAGMGMSLGSLGGAFMRRSSTVGALPPVKK